MKNNNKVLIIAAHPDDEVLGCGGTIIKHVENKSEVFVLILGEGITGRDKTRDREKRYKDILSLRECARKSSKIMGVKQLITYDFPDNRFDTVPLLDIIKVIETVKKQIKPSIVYTHHIGDLNIDHQIVCKATLTACRPMMKETVKRILSFEVPSSTEWAAPTRKDYFIPNIFVDVSSELNKKIQAMRAYRSEIRNFPHPRSTEAVRNTAKKWGVQVGMRAAEAFMLIRDLR